MDALLSTSCPSSSDTWLSGGVFSLIGVHAYQIKRGYSLINSLINSLIKNLSPKLSAWPWVTQNKRIKSNVTVAASPYLIEAVLGQLNTTLISPKNLPSPMVSNTIGSSCSDTTSTVPRWIKYIWKGRNLLTGTPKTCCFNFKSFCQNFISFYTNVNQETLCFSFFTIIANIGVKKNSLKRSVKELLLNMRCRDTLKSFVFKSLVTIQEIRLNRSFIIKWLTFYFLIWPLNLDFAQKFFEVARATKNCSKRQKWLKSCRAQSGRSVSGGKQLKSGKKNPKE